MTHILPTDRNGNIYYGPRTYAQAKEVMSQDDCPLAEEVVKMMWRAGFRMAAQRLANEYDLGKLFA